MRNSLFAASVLLLGTFGTAQASTTFSYLLSLRFESDAFSNVDYRDPVTGKSAYASQVTRADNIFGFSSLFSGLEPGDIIDFWADVTITDVYDYYADDDEYYGEGKVSDCYVMGKSCSGEPWYAIRASDTYVDVFDVGDVLGGAFAFGGGTEHGDYFEIAVIDLYENGNHDSSYRDHYGYFTVIDPYAVTTPVQVSMMPIPGSGILLVAGLSGLAAARRLRAS